MSTQKNLDGICLNPENLLVSKRNDLKQLKNHQLKSETDARDYARRFWDVYNFAVEQVNRDRSTSQSNKKEIVKLLQYELAGGNVDIRKNRGIVVLKTDKARYGFKLDDPSMQMRDAISIWTPLGSYYMLHGKTYHVPRIVKG